MRFRPLQAQVLAGEPLPACHLPALVAATDSLRQRSICTCNRCPCWTGEILHRWHGYAKAHVEGSGHPMCSIPMEARAPRPFCRPVGARENGGLHTWGRRASGALTPGYMPSPRSGLFARWQFGAGAERRRQAASLQEWATV